MSYSIAFHVIGICFWMAGLIILTRVLAVSEGASPTLLKTVKRLWFGYALPGLVIVLLSGLYQLNYRGFGYYFGPGQGWFHAKVTAVLILFVITALVWKQVARFCAGEAPNRKMLGAFHGISALLLVVLVFLTETHIQP